MPAFPYEESSTNLPELAVMLDDIDNNPYFEARDAPTEDRVNQVAMVRMNTQPWLVGFLQPRDVFLAPVRAQTQRAVLLTGLISAVVVAAAVVLARLLTGPITRLEMVASQVAEGDLMVQAEVESKDEIGRLAVSFNRMTSRLAELIGGLEQRVFERTRALQTSTEVARRLSTILDRNQLLLEVVEQVQDAFDYYHVHIYTVDEKSGKLVLAGGTGEAGRTMLAQNHQINIGQGLVGRAAETKTIVLVSDVSHESGWLPNSLLPETKAEVAIPIELGDELLGVLDVQHNIAGMLTEADSELLQSVASQVAVALRNANLYAETQQQAARETLINEINQRIRSTTNVDEALQIAVRELGRAVGAPKTAVRLTPAKPTNGHSEQAGFPQGK
ncbi:MAG: GAF domain-containing protein, partial [Anaerolineae bacterium]